MLKASTSLAFLLLVPWVGTCSLARCSGSQTPCGDLAVDICTKAPECSLVTGCADVGASNCGINDSQNGCEIYAPMCAWENNVCLGPCDGRSEANCSLVNGCNWAPCTGHVRDCSSYGNDSCPTWNGCYLESFD